MAQNIYYDAIIRNKDNIVVNQPDGLPAQNIDQFTQAIINKADDYRLSVIRFTIPANSLPIFNFNPTSNYYNFTLTYQGILGSASLVYIPNKPGVSISSSDAFYYDVNNYQHMIDMMNNALVFAYIDLLVNLLAASISPPSNLEYPPFIVLRDDYRLQFTVPKAGYLSSDPYKIWNDPLCDKIEIWCNYNLSRFLSNFNCLFPTQAALSNYVGNTIEMYQKFIVEDTGSNHNTYDFTLIDGWLSSITYSQDDIVSLPNSASVYFISLQNGNTGNLPTGTAADIWWSYYNGFESFLMTQESVSLSKWNDPQTIILVSDNLPTIPEYLPANLLSGVPTFRKILTDFSINADIGPEILQSITYLPTAQFRYIYFNSPEAINRIDLRLFYTDRQGNFKQLYFEKDQIITVKILFEKI